MSSTMSCLWHRTKNCGDLRCYLFENVVFVKSVAPLTRLSYIPCCLLIYITLSYIVGQCSLLVAYNVTSPCATVGVVHNKLLVKQQTEKSSVFLCTRRLNCDVHVMLTLTLLLYNN